MDRDGECPGRVVAGRDVVRQAAVRALVAVVCLLAEEAEAGAVEHDVVAVCACRPVAVDTAGGEAVAGHELGEHGLRVVVELARSRVVEDPRKLALQVPGVEEELPVDVRHEF